MKRLVLLVALGALLMASGCSASPSAATVNGSTISQSQLDSQLALASAPTSSGQAPTSTNQPVQCALDIQSGGALPAVTGVGENTVTSQFADSTLETLVLLALEKNALAQRHVTVTAADVAEARADFESQLDESESQANGSPCGLEGAQLTDRLPAAFLDQQAESLAYQEKLEEVVGHVAVGPAAQRAYYRSHTANLTQVCLNLIVADTLAAAQTVHSQIAAGATFAAAAQVAGVDQGSPSGGVGPCAFPSEISSQFGTTLGGTIDALATGQLAAPLEFQPMGQSGTPATYYLVVEVRQRQLVPFASVEGDLRLVLLQGGASVVGADLNRMVARAHVTVDPQYGSWSAAGGVSVPTPPSPAFLLNRNADQASSVASALGGLSGAG